MTHDLMLLTLKVRLSGSSEDSIMKGSMILTPTNRDNFLPIFLSQHMFLVSSNISWEIWQRILPRPTLNRLEEIHITTSPKIVNFQWKTSPMITNLTILLQNWIGWAHTNHNKSVIITTKAAKLTKVSHTLQDFQPINKS